MIVTFIVTLYARHFGKYFVYSMLYNSMKDTVN